MSKNIEDVMDKISPEFNKKYSEIIIDTKNIKPIEVFPTGLPSLDINLQIGGFPRKIIEILGMEGLGKTTLSLYGLRTAQRRNEKVAFLDMEHALNIQYMEQLGIDVNPDKLLLAQPDYGEQAFDLLFDLVKMDFGFIVIDSVTSMVPKAEIEGEDTTDNYIGLQARLMSKGLKKLSSLNKNTTIIFTNQFRDKIGVIYGSPKVSTGGNALKFYASMRLEISKVKDYFSTNNETEKIATDIQVKMIKTKFGKYGPITQLKMVHGMGFSISESLLNVCVERGIIKQSGSWFSYGDHKVGQGKDKVISFLNENTPLRKELINLITK